MPRLYLVRHAKPAASWSEDPDPGLDTIGVAQASATAQQLAGSMARLPVYTSPMRRCRETAEPLTKHWQCEASVLPAVAEIPSPPISFSARHDWLVAAMRGTWQQVHETAPPGSIDYLQWQSDVIQALVAMPHDCVIYTHYVAINVAVGAAQNRDDVLCCRPDHASVTVFDTDGGRLKLVELGREAETSLLTR
jgi:broad specificity phosphatase PhoE